MSCKCGGRCGGKCGGKWALICPISFGLAVGIVSFFAVLFWSLWIIKNGLPPMMVAAHMPMPTLQDGFVHGLFALIKGFLFGFFVALIYDLMRCCCRKKCDGPCDTAVDKSEAIK